MKDDNVQPLFIMLVGIPGSGKSYFIQNILPSFCPNRNFQVISTDTVIEMRAKQQGLTYSDVFQKEIKHATHQMKRNLNAALSSHNDIVWDQTNLTKKSRAGKLNEIPAEYYKLAVYFPTPNAQELERRLNSRPGKIIPKSVVRSMKLQLEIPTKEEGFDKILTY